MKLEEKLVSLRKEKGLSQLKLAEMMNVSRQAISRWEVGTAVPSTDNLNYLGRLYMTKIDGFLLCIGGILIGTSPVLVRRCALGIAAPSLLSIWQTVIAIFVAFCVGYHYYGKKRGKGKRSSFSLKYHCIVQAGNFVGLQIIKTWFL